MSYNENAMTKFWRNQSVNRGISGSSPATGEIR